MKFATAKEHRDFFQKHGWIEFENFIPEEQLTAVNQAIDLSLAERLNVPLDRLSLLAPEKQFLQGRDVWRSNPVLEKIVLQRGFAEIAIELIEKKTLRLGYDQFFPASVEAPFSKEGESVYSQFLSRSDTLEHVSCIQGITGGLIFSLGGDKEETADKNEINSEGIDIFPSKPGHAILFRPDILVKWKSIHAHPGQRYYLITYALPFSRYTLEPRDPHTHALKRLGYIFNDKLNGKLHPIFYR